METTPICVRRLLRAFALTLAALAPLTGSAAAHAAPLSFFAPYTGQGNVSVFDAAAGTGGWVGSIDGFPDPALADPLSLVSVVLFSVDEASHTLSGNFEFTSTDLLDTLFGTLSGSYFEDDILTSGGQFAVDYQILGGSGRFAGANGFGLSFVDYLPLAAGDNNYTESGLLVFEVPFAVPTPATPALVLAGLLGGLLTVGPGRRRSALARRRG